MKSITGKKNNENILKVTGTIAVFSMLLILIPSDSVFAYPSGPDIRPLSYYGMDASSALHGASAVPANEVGPSAGQYYNGFYAGNPVYYSSDAYLAHTYPGAVYAGTSYPGANSTGSYQTISTYPGSKDIGNTYINGSPYNENRSGSVILVSNPRKVSGNTPTRYSNLGNVALASVASSGVYISATSPYNNYVSTPVAFSPSVNSIHPGLSSEGQYIKEILPSGIAYER